MFSKIVAVLSLTLVIANGPASAQGVAVVHNGHQLLTQIPESCASAKQLGKGKLWLVDPLSQNRSPGPACQAIKSCKTDLANQMRSLFVFLRGNPDVVVELRSVAPDVFASSTSSPPTRLLGDLEGHARRLDDSSFASTPCDILWSDFGRSGGVNLVGGGKENSYFYDQYPFDGLMEAGQRLFSKAKSDFDTDESEYRTLIGFNDRYPGIERFERAYQAYTQVVQSDDIAGILRERKVFLGELNDAKARKQLLDEQASELSRLTTSLSDMAATCDREGLSEFSSQDILAMISALRADQKKYTAEKPAQRGDISSQLKIMATRYHDLEGAVRAARSEKAGIEEFRLMLVQRETVARHISDVASRDDMKGALDRQSLQSAGDIAERLHQFSSLDLKVIRERQSDFSDTLQQLTAVEQRFVAAQTRYNEAKDRDKQRRAVLDKVGPLLAQFPSTVSGRLSDEAGSLLANLRDKRDALLRLDNTRLLERPDYAADLAAVEYAITQLSSMRTEINEVDRLATDLTALKSKIDARGRELLDAATSSTLDEIDKSVSFLVNAKFPLAPVGHERLTQTRSRLTQFSSAVDAIMGMAEEKAKKEQEERARTAPMPEDVLAAAPKACRVAEQTYREFPAFLKGLPDIDSLSDREACFAYHEILTKLNILERNGLNCALSNYEPFQSRTNIYENEVSGGRGSLILPMALRQCQRFVFE